VLVGVPNFLSLDLMYIWSKHGKGNENYYSKGKLRCMMEKSGLTDIKIETSTFAYPSFTPSLFARRMNSLENLLGFRLGLGFLILAAGRKSAET